MKRNLVVGAWAFWLCVALSSCDEAPKGEGKAVAAKAAAQPMDERQQASYVVGLDVARTLQPVKDEIDLATVEQAIRAALAAEKPLLD